MIQLAKKRAIFLSFVWFFLSVAYSKEISAEELFAGKAEEAVIFQGDDGDKNSLIEAVENSLKYFELKISSLRTAEDFSQRTSLFYSFKNSQETLKNFLKIIKEDSSAQAIAQKVKKNFFFQEVNKKGVILTGYFEPIIAGSLKQQGEFKYPLYRPPDDLVEITNEINDEKKFGRMVEGVLVPYYSREETDKKGVLQGKGYEIFWLKDPWERFILHVQGSGRIKLANGQIYAVKYVASNGRPYRSIGQYLVRKGFIEERELSLRKVKEFFQKYPHLREEFFNLNERYIFFRPILLTEERRKGPEGALGFPLTPGRSIATDHNIYPAGGLCYLISTLPIIYESEKVIGRKRIYRFVLNQDKGAAMKGPARVDLFIGSGEEAEQIAGEMKEEGRIFIIKAK